LRVSSNRALALFHVPAFDCVLLRTTCYTGGMYERTYGPKYDRNLNVVEIAKRAAKAAK
jgi:hypothetical protein